jgi:uncharacterized membrane protein YbhN (UPF0104 family)
VPLSEEIPGLQNGSWIGERIVIMPRTIMTKSAGERCIRLLLAAVILALFVFAGMKVLSDPRFLEVFADLKHTNPVWIAAIAGVYLASSFLNAALTRIVVNRLDYRVTVSQAFAAFMVRIYGNLLIAKAGIGMSAAFMRVRYGVRIADFGSMLVGVTILQFLCIGLWGLAGQVLLLSFAGVPLDWLIAGTFAGCAVGSTACLLVPAGIFRFMPWRIAGFLRKIDAGIGQVRSGSRRAAGILALMALQSAVIALRAVRLWLAFAAVGMEVAPVGLFVSSLLGDIGLLIGVTPMGIGFREAAIGYSARLVGAAVPTAVAVTLVDRVIWSVTVLVVAQFILLGSLSKRQPPNLTNPNP